MKPPGVVRGIVKSKVGQRFLQNETPIKWNENATHLNPTKCPVCGELASQHLLTMKSGKINLPMIKCSCGSVFYPNAVAPDYESVEGKAAFLMRIDQAEGVDSIIKSLLISPEVADYAVVDIGCGIGFAVDYSAFEGRIAKGFDPSYSSALSRALLGIQIEGLPSNEEISDFARPNVVFASEVVEHVPDPRAFMVQLKEMAGDEGYVVLTTPNAEYVSPQNALPTLISILAPSQHLFLLSEKALIDLAKSAGFAWVHTWLENERLFAVAGPQPITLKSTFTEDKFSAYLTERLERATWIDENLRWRCFGYRLYKQRVHQGAYEESVPLWNGLVATYAKLGLNLDNPLKLVEQYTAGVKRRKRESFAEKFPFNAVMILFLRGTYLLAHDHDKIAAKPFFDAAVQISELYAKFFDDLPFQMYDREIVSVPTWVQEIMRQHWEQD